MRSQYLPTTPWLQPFRHRSTGAYENYRGDPPSRPSIISPGRREFEPDVATPSITALLPARPTVSDALVEDVPKRMGSDKTGFPRDLPADLTAFCMLGVDDYEGCLRFCDKNRTVWDRYAMLPAVACEFLGQGNEELASQVTSRFMMLHDSYKASGTSRGRCSWLATLVRSSLKREDFEQSCSNVIDRLRKSVEQAQRSAISSSSRSLAQYRKKDGLAAVDPPTLIPEAKPVHESKRLASVPIATNPEIGQIGLAQALRIALDGIRDTRQQDADADSHSDSDSDSKDIKQTLREKFETQKKLAKTRKESEQAKRELVQLTSQLTSLRANTRQLRHELRTEQLQGAELGERVQKHKSANQIELERQYSVEVEVQQSLEQKLVTMERKSVESQQKLNNAKKVQGEIQEELKAQETTNAQAVENLDQARTKAEDIQRELERAQKKAGILREQLQAMTDANFGLLNRLIGTTGTIHEMKQELDATTLASTQHSRSDSGVMNRMSPGAHLNSSVQVDYVRDLPDVVGLLERLSITVGDDELEEDNDAPSSNGTHYTRKRKPESQDDLTRVPTKPRASRRTGNGCLKRTKDDDEEDDDGNKSGDNHCPQDDDHDALACPYFVKYPDKYKACGKLRLMTIAALKQHLRRKHKGPEYYCYRCWGEFPSVREVEEHGQEDICSRTEKPMTDRIERDEWQRIERRHRGVTQAEAWVDIYKIIFNEEDPPSIGHTIQEHELNHLQCKVAQHFSRLFAAFPEIAGHIRNEAKKSSTNWTNLQTDTKDIVQLALLDHSLISSSSNDTSETELSDDRHLPIPQDQYSNRCIIPGDDNYKLPDSTLRLNFYNTSSEAELFDTWHVPTLQNEHSDRFMIPDDDNHGLSDPQSFEDSESQDLYGSDPVDIWRMNEDEVFADSTIPTAGVPPFDQSSAASTNSTSVPTARTPSTPSDSAEEDWSQFIDPAVMLDQGDPKPGNSRSCAHQLNGGHSTS